MVVNFEFLGGEPLDNVITCMNFRVDKVVFFGYEEVIRSEKERTVKFLKKYCGIENIVFRPLSHYDLNAVLNVMKKEVQNELERGNQIYFDITGGESLLLVAFGMLAKEFDAPMHMYDIINDKLIELGGNREKNISMNVPVRKIPMSLKLLVKMHGGKINSRMQKKIKGIDDPEILEDAEKIYQIAKKNWDYWNPFSDFLKKTMVPTDNETLRVSKRMSTVTDALDESRTKLKTLNRLNDIIDALVNDGIILDLERDDSYYRFRFKSKAVKDYLWEGGSVLELHTYRKELRTGSECQIGVHLDWDGVIHDVPGIDVLNEIDILSLHGNVATFISCKSGKMGAQQVLHALYELETVASRFGGKYAKKILVTSKGIGDVHMERAREMGIEVR